MGSKARGSLGLPTSLTSRLFLFALLALLPVFGVLWMLEQQLQAGREAEIRDLARRRTAQANTQIERVIEGQRTLLLAVSSSPTVMELDAGRCARYLSSLVEALPHLQGIAVLGLDGRPRCGDDPVRPTPNYADRPYFRAAIDTGRFVVGRYTVGRADPSARILPFAAPVREEDGRIVAVAAAGLRLSHLQSIVQAFSLPPNGSLTIADSEGTILARTPLPERFVGTRIPDEFVDRWVKATAAGVEEVQSQDGTWRIVAYSPAALPPEGIYVSSGYALAEVQAMAGEGWRWNLALLTAGLVGAALTSLAAGAALIQRPVRKLVELAQAWSGGTPPATRRPIPTREFETVTASLDAMGQAIEKRSLAAARQQELLVAELHHRVKNLLAMVQAIGTQTAAGTSTPAEFRSVFSQRIQALARTNELLTARNWEGVELRSLLRAEVEAMPRPEDVELSGPAIVLPSSLGMPLTLIAHELATNAVKYGCQAGPGGRLDISWQLEVREDGGRMLDLRWREHGTAPLEEAPGPPRDGGGFGSRLIARLVESLGTGTTTLAPDGLVFTLRIDFESAGTGNDPDPPAG